MQFIGVLTTLFILFFGWIVFYRLNPNIGAYFHAIQRRMRSTSPKHVRSGKRITSFLGRELETRLPGGLIERIERVIRYAGKPQGYEVADWIIVQLALLTFGVVLLYLIPQKLVGVMLFGIFNFAPFITIRSRAKKRRFLAREYTRRMKRQYRQQILHEVQIDEALRNVAETAPGEFGDTFRKYMLLSRESMHFAMHGLRDEYGIPELDQFAMAIEMAETKTSSELIKELTRQIEDEEKYVDQYLKDRQQRLQVAQGGVIFFLAIIILALCGTFAAVGMVHMMGQGGFM